MNIYKLARLEESLRGAISEYTANVLRAIREGARKPRTKVRSDKGKTHKKSGEIVFEVVPDIVAQIEAAYLGIKEMEEWEADRLVRKARRRRNDLNSKKKLVLFRRRVSQRAILSNPELPDEEKIKQFLEDQKVIDKLKARHKVIYSKQKEKGEEFRKKEIKRIAAYRAELNMRRRLEQIPKDFICPVCAQIKLSTKQWKCDGIKTMCRKCFNKMERVTK